MKWMAVLAALAAAGAEERLFRVVDLDAGTTETVTLPGGRKAAVRLIAVRETRDSMRSAIRSALVDVEINGSRATLGCGNYNLPIAVGGVQADCAVTRGYYGNARKDHWGLDKQARIRLWPARSPWMPPGTFVYPARQRWFATNTQMANEPAFVDDGITFESTRIYYHGALDIGGAEGMVDVLAATDAQVVALGKQVLPEYRQGDWPIETQYDRIYVRDLRGWFHRYVHLFSFDPSVRLGERVRMGQKIGTLGKEGTSGGWAHLHYEILDRQPSGKWGTIEGYAFLWEAWLREQRPELIAVARPHVAGVVGEKVVLDGSRSWSRSSKIVRYDWATEQGAASGSRVERVYTKPGDFSEVLKITDASGRTAYDIATVHIGDSAHRDQRPPTLHAAYSPTMDIRPGQPVTFQARTFGTAHGEESWDFGDGSAIVKTRSDGSVRPMAKNGYAITKHAFARPGDYIVNVQRSNAHGQKAVARLHVRVAAGR